MKKIIVALVISSVLIILTVKSYLSIKNNMNNSLPNPYSISITPSAITTETPTIAIATGDINFVLLTQKDGWDTFSSSEDSLSIGLPSNWTKEGNSSFKGPKEIPSFEVTKTSAKSIQEAKDQILGWSNKTNIKQITSGNVPATEYQDCIGIEGCAQEYYVFAVKNGIVYQFVFNTYTDSQIVPHEDQIMYNQIVSGIKFY